MLLGFKVAVLMLTIAIIFRDWRPGERGAKSWSNGSPSDLDS